MMIKVNIRNGMVQEVIESEGSYYNGYAFTFEQLKERDRKIWDAARVGMRMGDSTEAYKGFDDYQSSQGVIKFT